MTTFVHHKEIFFRQHRWTATEDEKKRDWRVRRSADNSKRTQRVEVDDNNIVNNNVTSLHISEPLPLPEHICAKCMRDARKIKRSLCKMSHQLARSSLTISFLLLFHPQFLIKIFLRKVAVCERWRFIFSSLTVAYNFWLTNQRKKNLPQKKKGQKIASWKM